MAVDGVVSVIEEGAAPRMERLAARYWVDEDPAVANVHAKMVETWRQTAAHMRALTIVPEAMRSCGA